MTAELFEHNISTKEDIIQLASQVERDMRELKKDIIISIGSMIMVAVAVIPIILKLIHF